MPVVAIDRDRHQLAGDDVDPADDQGVVPLGQIGGVGGDDRAAVELRLDHLAVGGGDIEGLWCGESPQMTGEHGLGRLRRRFGGPKGTAPGLIHQ